MERKKITFDSFIRGSIGCVLVAGILMLVERLSGVLLPFFIAWLIAYMVYPLVKFFQYKLRLKSRIVSIFCALFLITLVGVSLFYLLVPPMISEIGRMNDLLVTYLTNGAGNQTVNHIHGKIRNDSGSCRSPKRCSDGKTINLLTYSKHRIT